MATTRRSLLAGAAAGLALSTAPIRALAGAPRSGVQVPGVYRRRVGDIEVTALLDGWFDLDPKFFPAAPPEEAADLLGRAFLPKGPIRTAVNAYLVNTGDQLVLIDAGAAGAFVPTMGFLADHLRLAGVDTEAVDAVLVTHLHPDHVGGVLTKEGASAFAKAELVVPDAEWEFWTPPEAQAQAADELRGFFQLAQKAVAAYAGRLTRFQPGREVVPGITALAIPGHTPGHTAFRVASGTEALLVTGDLVHAAALQFARPDWSLAFDVDQKQAAATRRRILDMAASDRMAIAGMHLPFPGIGHVARSGASYAFMPAPWEPVL